MTIYLTSDFAPKKVISAFKIFYDAALHLFVFYGVAGHITMVDLNNTHFIRVVGDL